MSHSSNLNRKGVCHPPHQCGMTWTKLRQKTTRNKLMGKNFTLRIMSKDTTVLFSPRFSSNLGTFQKNWKEVPATCMVCKWLVLLSGSRQQRKVKSIRPSWYTGSSVLLWTGSKISLLQRKGGACYMCILLDTKWHFMGMKTTQRINIYLKRTDFCRKMKSVHRTLHNCS